MSKRHTAGTEIIDKVRRAQEVIMAQSGVDEYYEIIKILLIKYFLENKSGSSSQASYTEANAILQCNQGLISEYIDSEANILISEQLFHEVFLIFHEINIHELGYQLLDSIFEFLTSKKYKADKGQYFTPRHVVEMIVSAVSPKPNEMVCDPAVGSGAFLKSTFDYQQRNFNQTSALYGFDYSNRACKIAKLISFMCARDKLTIHQLDSLNLDSSEKIIESTMGKSFTGFDVILTNPPFAGDVTDEEYFKKYEISCLFSKKIERDTLFIERCIRLLKIGGKLAIILPDSKISGKRFDSVRRWLSKYLRIIAVVSLHRYTFLPHTSQKASILFGVRTNFGFSKEDYEITFIQSEMSGKNSNGSPVIRNDNIDKHNSHLLLKHDLDEIPKLIWSQYEIYSKEN